MAYQITCADPKIRAALFERSCDFLWKYRIYNGSNSNIGKSKYPNKEVFNKSAVYLSILDMKFRSGYSGIRIQIFTNKTIRVLSVRI